MNTKIENLYLRIMKMGKIAVLFCHLLVIVGGLMVFSATSCVSMQTYRNTQARALRSEHNAANLQAEIDQLREQRDALDAQYNMDHSTPSDRKAPNAESSTEVDQVTE